MNIIRCSIIRHGGQCDVSIFSFLWSIPAGQYKFRLRSANSNDMIESNAVDFEIVSFSGDGGDSEMCNYSDEDNMDSDKGSNGSNFDDFEDFDGYDRNWMRYG